MDKILCIFKSLRPEEIDRFKAYLESPYFSIPNYLKEFGFSWIRVYSDNNWLSTNAENTWSSIFPGKPFHDGKWRKRKSELLRLIEQFLLVERQMKMRSKMEEDIDLLLEFHERKINGEFEKKWRLMEKGLTPILQDGDDILNRSKFYRIVYNHLRGLHNPNKPNPDETRLLEIDRELMNTYFRWMEMKTQAIIANRILMGSPVPKSNEPLWPLSSDIPNQPLFNLYKVLIESLTLNTIQSLNSFLEVFQKESSHISSNEGKLLLSFGINQLTRQYLRNKDKSIAEKLFEFYELAISQELILDRWGEITHVHFKNIISVSLKVDRPDFANQFITTFGNRLGPGDENSDTLALSKAMIAFSKGDYKTCLKIVRKANPKGYLTFDFRVYELKALYELKEWDQLEYKIQNYDRFLHRSTLPKDRINLRLESLKFLKRIINASHPFDQNLDLLKIEIEENQPHDSDWLLQKIKEKMA
ncbi:MAG: hypothetical protein H6581_05435 [Bacteroidia bacterium]|nr:hypothetical protein [Bacteroidia bacterium]